MVIIFKILFQDFSKDNIISEYSKYPELWLLTNQIKPDIVTEIINNTQDNNYGWSTDGCFILKNGVGKDKEIVKKEEFANEIKFKIMVYNFWKEK